MKRRALVLLFLGAFALPPADVSGAAETAAPPAPYTIETITPPDGASIRTIGALLDDGSVYVTVKYPQETYVQSSEVMRWRDGEFTSMHGPGRLPPVAQYDFYEVRDARGDDLLVGTYHTSGEQCAFLLNQDGYRCDDMWHSAINGAGAVAGTAQTYRDGFTQWGPYRLGGGTLEFLENRRLGGRAYDINDAGVVVGAEGRDDKRPMLWRDGAASPLPSLTGDRPASAHAVSALGRVAGTIDTDPQFNAAANRPALWQAGSMTHLPVHAQYGSYNGTDVNDLGQVLYTGYAAAGLYHGGGAVALADLVPGHTLEFPSNVSVRLNGVGQIAGFGNLDGEWTAFVLTPSAAPLPPATQFKATQSGSEATVTWTRPDDARIVDAIIRRKAGTTAPATPEEGEAVPVGSGPSTTVSGLSTDTAHSFTIFMVGADGQISGPAMSSTVPAAEFRRVSLSPSSATFGDPITIRGRLVRSDTSAPLPGVKVQLNERYTQQVVVTDAAGWATFTEPAHSISNFHLFTDGGGKWPPAVSRNRSVELYETPTKLTISVSDTDVDDGDHVSVRGRLTRADTGAPVRGATVSLFDSIENSSSYSLETDDDGRVVFSVAPHVNYRTQDTAEHGYHLNFGGYPSLAAAASPVKTVRAHMITVPITVAAELVPQPSGTERTIAVQLLRSTTGEPEPDRDVRLYSQAPGQTQWYDAGWEQTNTKGRAFFTVAPNVSTRYRVVHHARSGYEETSAETFIPVSARLRPHVERPLVPAGTGARASVSGHMLPGQRGRTITLTRLRGEGWKKVAATTTGRRGRYSFSVPVRDAVRYRHRVATPATESYLGGTAEAPAITGYRMNIIRVEPGGGGTPEWVEVRNDGKAAVPLGGWELSNQAEQLSGTLPRGTRLRAGDTVRVFTGYGSREGVIYLGLDHELWPTGGGTARLSDPYDVVAAQLTYK